MSNRCFELTAIDLSREERWLEDLRRQAADQAAGRTPSAFREVDFNEDDLERPIAESAEAPAPDVDIDLSNPPEGLYTPILVFENDIREIYPRRGGRKGTRIVYRSGAARPVKEEWEIVRAMFVGVANPDEGTAQPTASPRSRSRSRSRQPMETREAEASRRDAAGA